MTEDLSRPFDRVTYRDGQLLTALDLNDGENRDAWLRRLHTRYLHGSWGIALGFEVKTGDPGNLEVAPGHAVDGLGRDLLLPTAVAIPVPNVGTSVVLTMRFPDDRRTDLPDPHEVCLGEVGPIRERPLFAWRRCEEVRWGLEIPLARVTPSQKHELDLGVQRYLRAQARPHFAGGETERGQTAWKSWSLGNNDVGLELEVDTSVGAFRQVPRYFALLRTRDSQLSGDEILTFPLGSFSHIQAATRTGFIYRLLRGVLPPTLANVTLDQVRKGWTLSWFGFEPETECGAYPGWALLAKLPPGLLAP